MQAKADKNTGPLTILLADDSPNIHKAVALGLRKEPYELIYCDNGQDALRIIKEKNPRIALLDLDMPGPTGAELVQMIKKDPKSSQTKVILLCSSFDQVDEAHLDSLPADGRIWKPFEAQVLLSLIKNIIAAPSEKPEPRISADQTSVNLPKLSASITSEINEDLAQNLTRATFKEIENQHLEQDKTSSGADILDKLNPQIKEPQIETYVPTESTWMGVPGNQEVSSEFSEEASEGSLWESNSPSPTLIIPSQSDEEIYQSQESTVVLPIAPDLSSTQKDSETLVISPSSLAAKSGMDEEQVRKIIRDEIQKAFNSWLKDELQSTLNSVINEIDREP